MDTGEEKEGVDSSLEDSVELVSPPGGVKPTGTATGLNNGVRPSTGGKEWHLAGIAGVTSSIPPVGVPGGVRRRLGPLKMLMSK